jgi:hypothetical protein
MNKDSKFYKFVNNAMTNFAILFSETVGRFGAFILTKYNRNYFFLLLGAVAFLTIINEYKPIPTLIMVVICSTIMILTLGKDIGKILEDKEENDNIKN